MKGRRKSRFVPLLPRSPWRRLALALVVALVAVAFYYYGQRFVPPAEDAPPVRMPLAQEEALGDQAAAFLTRQHGGLDPDPDGQALVQRIGERLVARSDAGAAPYRFRFHLLADTRVIDAFALPGGPVLMTAGLAARLRTEGEFAAVLAHAAAHITERHTLRHLEAHPSEDTTFATRVARAAAMTYQPGDEAKADTMAVRLMAAAGYDPRALIGMLAVLEAAAANSRPPAFWTTHPGPDERAGLIQHTIEERFPEGVPEDLVK